MPPVPHVTQVQAMLERGGEYRRNGSAALSLAHIADGRLDGFVGLHLKAWDVVAGMVLVSEAGGWISDFLRGAGLTKVKSLDCGGSGDPRRAADIGQPIGANRAGKHGARHADRACRAVRRLRVGAPGK
jgi:hypothetical protein